MMNSLSPANFITPPSPTPEATPVCAERTPAFAQALDRAAQAQGSAEQPAANSADDSADDSTAPPANTDDPARRISAGKHSRNAAPATSRDLPGRALPTTPPTEDDQRTLAVSPADSSRDSSLGDDAASALIDLAALMSGLTTAARPPHEAGVADEPGSTVDADIIDAARGHGARTPRRAHGGSREDGITQESGHAAAASPGLGRHTGEADEAVAIGQRQRDGSAQWRTLESIVGNPNTLAPAAAVSATTAARTSATAAQFQGELAAALGTPEFASALGSQVSVLIRDGVSHAQLRLNPADMGPVSVHIRLDGDSAQVDFSALQALTRQALQDAVPALASALRESGLTLSGGGVFEQPRQPDRREPTQADASTRSGNTRLHVAPDAAGASTLHGVVSRAMRARGMVDLYA